jgi:hypothetical protein
METAKNHAGTIGASRLFEVYQAGWVGGWLREGPPSISMYIPRIVSFFFLSVCVTAAVWHPHWMKTSSPSSTPASRFSLPFLPHMSFRLRPSLSQLSSCIFDLNCCTGIRIQWPPTMDVVQLLGCCYVLVIPAGAIRSGQRPCEVRALYVGSEEQSRAGGVGNYLIDNVVTEGERERETSITRPG